MYVRMHECMSRYVSVRCLYRPNVNVVVIVSLLDQMHNMNQRNITIA